MWCPDCGKEVVFGAPGPEVLGRAEAGEIIYGGPEFPAPCPICGNPLDWGRVLPRPRRARSSDRGKSPGADPGGLGPPP